MSKIVFTFLFLAFTFHLKADVKPCPDERILGNQDTNKLANLAMKVAMIAEKVSDDELVKVETADLYLKALGTRTNFDENELNNYIKTLTPICENNSLEKKLRSKGCATLSGLHGAMAKKLQLGGTSNGLSAYKYIKAAISIDPFNREAVFGHALAVYGISEQNYFVKKLVESKLGVSIFQEAQEAKANLIRVKLDTHQIFQKIEEIK